MKQKAMKLLRILTRAIPILLLFGVTLFLVAGLLAWVQGTSLTDNRNIYLAIICALVGWLFVIIFHFKRETLQMPLGQTDDFLERAQTHLEEFGYEITSSSRQRLVALPLFHSWLLGGGIQIRLEDDVAHLTGPKYYVERLRHCLRMSNHLDNVQKNCLKAQLHRGEQRWQRVQISLRLPATEWQGIYEQILEPLLREQAEVHCEIGILAQSETGIGDYLVEAHIREALKNRGIKADFLKGPLLPTVSRQETTPQKQAG